LSRELGPLMADHVAVVEQPVEDRGGEALVAQTPPHSVKLLLLVMIMEPRSHFLETARRHAGRPDSHSEKSGRGTRRMTPTWVHTWRNPNATAELAPSDAWRSGQREKPV
jgi:hypothetical protein